MTLSAAEEHDLLFTDPKRWIEQAERDFVREYRKTHDVDVGWRCSGCGGVLPWRAWHDACVSGSVAGPTTVASCQDCGAFTSVPVVT